MTRPEQQLEAFFTALSNYCRRQFLVGLLEHGSQGAEDVFRGRERGEISTGPTWTAFAPVLHSFHNHRAELPDGWV